MKIIERDIQDAIVDLLPEDAQQARLIMAQLSASMILSQEASLEAFLAEVSFQYCAYIASASK